MEKIENGILDLISEYTSSLDRTPSPKEKRSLMRNLLKLRPAQEVILETFTKLTPMITEYLIKEKHQIGPYTGKSKKYRPKHNLKPINAMQHAALSQETKLMISNYHNLKSALKSVQDSVGHFDDLDVSIPEKTVRSACSPFTEGESKHEELVNVLSGMSLYEPISQLDIRDVGHESWKNHIELEKVLRKEEEKYKVKCENNASHYLYKINWIKGKCGLKISDLEKQLAQSELQYNRLLMKYCDLESACNEKSILEKNIAQIDYTERIKDLPSALVAIKKLKDTRNLLEKQATFTDKTLRNLKQKTDFTIKRNKELLSQKTGAEKQMSALKQSLHVLLENPALSHMNTDSYKTLIDTNKFTKLKDQIQTENTKEQQKQEQITHSTDYIRKGLTSLILEPNERGIKKKLIELVKGMDPGPVSEDRIVTEIDQDAAILVIKATSSTGRVSKEPMYANKATTHLIQGFKRKITSVTRYRKEKRNKKNTSLDTNTGHRVGTDSLDITQTNTPLPNSHQSPGESIIAIRKVQPTVKPPMSVLVQSSTIILAKAPTTSYEISTQTNTHLQMGPLENSIVYVNPHKRQSMSPPMKYRRLSFVNQPGNITISRQQILPPLDSTFNKHPHSTNHSRKSSAQRMNPRILSFTDQLYSILASNLAGFCTPLDPSLHFLLSLELQGATVSSILVHLLSRYFIPRTSRISQTDPPPKLSSSSGFISIPQPKDFYKKTAVKDLHKLSILNSSAKNTGNSTIERWSNYNYFFIEEAVKLYRTQYTNELQNKPPEDIWNSVIRTRLQNKETDIITTYLASSLSNNHYEELRKKVIHLLQTNDTQKLSMIIYSPAPPAKTQWESLTQKLLNSTDHSKELHLAQEAPQFSDHWTFNPLKRFSPTKQQAPFEPLEFPNI